MINYKENILIGIFLLISSMLGVGFLTLPGMTKTSGVILTILILVITSIFSTLGSLMITRGIP